LRVKCGPIYGPIKNQGKNYFVHELCALWAPAVFLNDKNKFRNLFDEIKRSRKTRCSLCKERGGVLGCRIETCKNTYHYNCAKDENCLFAIDKYIIYCPQHRDEAPEEYKDIEKAYEEENEMLEHYICSICMSGLDEDHIVICESCDRGFHTNCHRPIIDLENIDEDEPWYC
jgi:hypothetical protein